MSDNNEKHDSNGKKKAYEKDYDSVIIPERKSRDEYDAVERRKEILEMMRKVGTPDNMPTQRRLADKYGVSAPTINRDMDVLSKYIEENLGDRAVSKANLVYEKAVDELMEDEEYREAARVVGEWQEWLADRGAIEEEPDEVEVSGEGIEFNFGRPDE